MAIVAVGGALATHADKKLDVPPWLPITIVIGFAALGIGFTYQCQPRKMEELGSKIVMALIVVPPVAMVVWGLLRLFS